MTTLEITLTADQIATILGFSIGYLWGNAFSNFDAFLKYGEGNGADPWLPQQNPVTRFIISNILDAMHHFQYGLILMLLVLKHTWFTAHPTISLILLWMGWGLIVSDWKDYKNILKRLGLGGD